MARVRCAHAVLACQQVQSHKDGQRLTIASTVSSSCHGSQDTLQDMIPLGHLRAPLGHLLAPLCHSGQLPLLVLKKLLLLLLLRLSWRLLLLSLS